MTKEPSSARADARGLRVILLRSTFNATVVDGLVAGARDALHAMGARDEDVTIADVPGAFELPLAAQAAASSGRFDVVVALGAVIRGETDHYEHIAREAASGLAAVARESGIPVGFGVLTVSEESQARARAKPGSANKGAEAARAAVATARLLDWLRRPAAGARARKGTASARGRAGARPRKAV